jgi:predicted RND superfamily exporter protein
VLSSALAGTPFLRNAVAKFARLPRTRNQIVLAAVLLTGAAYVRLEPHYRLADQVPDKEQALAATARLDQKLTGANPVHVMIQWQGGQSLYDAATLKVIGTAHAVLEQTAGLGNVWSLESLRRWLAEAGDTRIETVKKYIGLLPDHLVRRFITKDETAVLVTGRLPDVDAGEILPVVEKIDGALEPVRRANPGYEISVTGLPAIAARNSAKLIGELNWGLVGDMFVIFIFLGLALTSVLAGVASVLPSLFPIFATGALLWATGEGLQFASIIAITVAFALAIDSTIHFLNRFRIEEDRLGGGPGTATPALIATVSHIGPAVVLTTIVLALGLGVTMLSDLPSLRLFGRLAGVCLFASLIGQLVILPATIALYRRIFPRRSKGLGQVSHAEGLAHGTGPQPPPQPRA